MVVAELSPILAELERLYPLLRQMYGGRLHEAGGDSTPIINLASKGRKRTQVGWYERSVWNDSQEDTLAGLAGVLKVDRVETQRAEITIATELLDDPVQTVAELLRQLIVHDRVARMRWQWRGQDCADISHIVGANGYYPIAWRQEAARFGFVASVLPDQPSRGWAGWAPGPDFLTWCKENINYRVFEVNRDSAAVAVRKGSRMKKWTCDCTTIRCATRVVGHCDRCGAKFAWAEKSEPDPYEGV